MLAKSVDMLVILSKLKKVAISAALPLEAAHRANRTRL